MTTGPAGGARTYDVLVVGAGPAGSALAWRLARGGVRVAVADAHDFPRSKPCGDSISPGATPLLKEMGVLPGLHAAGAAALEGWRLRSPDGTWFEGRFSASAGPAPSRGLALSRRDLDVTLLEAACAAGADFLPHHRVFDLDDTRNSARSVRARTGSGNAIVLRARWIVGADGLRSVVARRGFGVRYGRRPRLALVRRYRSAVSGAAAAEPMGEMRLSAEGCLGIAPTGPGSLNVALVISRSAAPRISADRESFFVDALAGYGARDRVRGLRPDGPIEVTGPFEVAPRGVTLPGLLLVGDAAGYFDPFTGQGIFRALAGARLAAECLEHALAVPRREADLRKGYAAALRGLLSPGRRLQRSIDFVIHRPALIDAIGHGLAAQPGLVSLLLDVTGDRIAPAQLLSPRRLAASLIQARAAGA